MGREPAQLKRTYPEVWRLGENLADDRFDIIPGEDHEWDPSMVDDYLREVAEDTVKLVEATARRQGETAESGALATVGVACGSTLEPKLREYIRTGAAADDTAAIAKFRDDYDRDRQELLSRSARLAYPIRDGIPVMLEEEARTLSDEELERLPPRTPLV